MTRPAPTEAAAIAALRDLGEVQGYASQREADGNLTVDVRQLLATRAAEIQMKLKR